MQKKISGINYNGAIKLAIKNGDRTVKSRIKNRLWPNSSEKSKEVYISRLLKKKLIGSPETIRIFCEECNVTTDFMFYSLNND